MDGAGLGEADITAGVSRCVEGPLVASLTLPGHGAHDAKAMEAMARVLDDSVEEAVEKVKIVDFQRDIELQYELLTLAPSTGSGGAITSVGAQDLHFDEATPFKHVVTDSQAQQAPARTEAQVANCEAGESTQPNAAVIVDTGVRELKQLWQGECPHWHSIHVCSSDGDAEPTLALEESNPASQHAGSPSGRSDPDISMGFVRARVQDLSERIQKNGTALGPTPFFPGVASVPPSMWRSATYYDMSSADTPMHHRTSTKSNFSELSHLARASLTALGASGLEEIIAKVTQETVRQVIDENLPALEARVDQRCEVAAREAWQSLARDAGGVLTQASIHDTCSGITMPATEASTRFLESRCLELQDAVDKCLHMLDDARARLGAQAPLQRLTVGSHVEVVETGRLGELVLDDGSEKPYKVHFNDGQEPRCLWYRHADISAAEPAQYHWQLSQSPPTSPSGIPASLASPPAAEAAAAAAATPMTTPEPGSTFVVGDHVRLVKGDRHGEVVLADDTELPYKVRFFDSLLPFADWHRESEIEPCCEGAR